MSAELDAKRLELLQTAFPYVTAVTALVNTTNPYHKLPLEVVDGAAKSLGLGVVGRVEAASPAALRALRPEVFSGAGAVFVVGDGMFWNFRRDIVALLNEAHLPAIYPERDYADDGGLMAYGANVADNFHRAAGYVDRILKGAKPGDLPIQQPVKFDFVVNLKTAKALGLTIPPSILAPLCLPHVWPCSPLLRRERDQAGLLDPAAWAAIELRAEGNYGHPKICAAPATPKISRDRPLGRASLGLDSLRLFQPRSSWR